MILSALLRNDTIQGDEGWLECGSAFGEVVSDLEEAGGGSRVVFCAHLYICIFESVVLLEPCDGVSQRALS